MSTYKKSDRNTYTSDFQWKGRRFQTDTGCTTKREADAWEKAYKQRLKSQAVTTPNGRDLTLREAALLYWHEVGQMHENSDTTDTDLKRVKDHLGGGRLLSSITDADVAGMVASRRSDGVANATVNRSTTEVLRKIITRARDVWESPTPKIKWSKHILPEPKARIREASPKEERTIMGQVRDDYLPAVRFALLTGCRRIEIVGLIWPHVDWFNREIKVIGKRGRVRIIAMPDAVYELLWDLKDHHNHNVFTYVAKRTMNGKLRGHRYPITMAGFKTEWRRTKDRAEVHNFVFHDLRHTAATRVLRESNLRVVQEMLGHADPKTTARYAHVTTSDMHDAMNAAAAKATKSPSRNPSAKRGNGPKQLK